MGRSEFGWICPDAPFNQDPSKLGPNEYRSGGVNSPWVHPHWEDIGTWLTPGMENQVNPKLRVSSYAVNGWLILGLPPLYPQTTAPWTVDVYENESHVAQPSLTPVLGDGTFRFAFPKAADLPATDLYDGGSSVLYEGGSNLATFETGGTMFLLTIPRHG